MNQVNSQSIVTLLPLAAFLIVLILQLVRPRRDLLRSGLARVFQNLLLFIVNSVLLRLFVPLSLVVVAVWAESHQFGLFNWLSWPSWITYSLSIVLQDFMIYWQHVATHKIPVLWRVHKVHHADTDMDVTTAIRFHPVELILSMFYKATVILLLGVPAGVVVIFELLLFVSPLFNHSNVKLSTLLDRWLRYLIVTPDMHRIHHSIYRDEHDSNYGFFIVWWDKLFHTYSQQPKEGHEAMRIGLDDAALKCQRVDHMLLTPFK